MTRLDAMRGFSPANRYGLVLLLILVTYIVTVSARGSVGQAVIVLVQLLTVWIAFSVSESPRARRAAGWAILGVAVLGVLGLILGTVGAVDDAVRALFVISTLLYIVAPVVIVRHIFRRNVVDGQTVLGAIAAYLLIGMMFAFCYEAIGAIQSAPFYGAQGDGSPSDDLFFSFITLTTTGYGNLVPAGNPGQTAAVLEAIAGQLFLVTAVAKVITAWRTPAERRAEEHPQDGAPPPV